MRRFRKPFAMLALATIIAFVLVPVVAVADSWYGGFVRDSQYNLNVNCKVGCSSGGGTLTPVYVQDKTSATPAPVYAPGNGGNVSGMSTVAMPLVYQGGVGWNRQYECADAGGSSSGAACVSAYAKEYDLVINGAASANQSWNTGNMQGYPSAVTVCVNSSAATTFTITEQMSNNIYDEATIYGTQTKADVTLAAAGSMCENISLATNIQVATSAAATVSVQVEAKF